MILLPHTCIYSLLIPAHYYFIIWRPVFPICPGLHAYGAPDLTATEKIKRKERKNENQIPRWLKKVQWGRGLPPWLGLGPRTRWDNSSPLSHLLFPPPPPGRLSCLTQALVRQMDKWILKDSKLIVATTFPGCENEFMLQKLQDKFAFQSFNSGLDEGIKKIASRWDGRTRLSAVRSVFVCILFQLMMICDIGEWLWFQMKIVLKLLVRIAYLQIWFVLNTWRVQVIFVKITLVDLW